MAERRIFVFPTGGTIGMSNEESKALTVDDTIQKKVDSYLQKVPLVRYEIILSPVIGDSSDHTKGLIRGKQKKGQLIELVSSILDYSNEKDGIIVKYGSDTMNLFGCIAGLAGNEMWRFPITLVGAIKDPKKSETDAYRNAITAGVFTAFGNGSGVFQVRSGKKLRSSGFILTYRIDRPGAFFDWHDRSFKPKKSGQKRAFARVILEDLFDEDLNFKIDMEHIRDTKFSREIAKYIIYNRKLHDKYLDTPDPYVIGGRGFIPHVIIQGLGEKKIKNFKRENEDSNPRDIANKIEGIVSKKIKEGFLYGKIIPYIAFIESIKRDKRRDFGLYKKWDIIFNNLISKEFNIKQNLVNRIIEFWDKYSNIKNCDFDFRDIVSPNTSDDPDYLRRVVSKVPPKAIILQATGPSGVRVKHKEESFIPFFEACKKQEIPVILYPSSYEVTNFKYEHGITLLENDLCFFSGTLPHSLIEPRVALLNHLENKKFLTTLVDKLDVKDYTKKEIRRNIYRQLLSGSNYANPEEDKISDRKRVENLYGTETRVDLLGGLHAKKAILAAYLNEVHIRKLQLPMSIMRTLN